MENYKKLYFYLVTFSPKNDELNSLNLGLFSTKKKANNKIMKSKNLPGFNEYSIADFKIKKTAVLCSENAEKKKIKYLYWLYSEIDYIDYSEWKDYGYYHLKKIALNDLKWIINHTRYGKNNKKSFIIDKIKVNLMTCWSEGFIPINDE